MFYKIILGIMKFLFKIFYRVDVSGLENLEDLDKPYILCSNHIHVFDPVAISINIDDQISWMGKKELFEKRFLGKLLYKFGAFPVDRDAGLSALRTSMKLLRQDKILGIFPEGTRVKNMDYENAKPGVALLSIKTKTPLVPIHIQSSYRIFSKIRIVIGEPFEFTEAYDKNVSSEEYKQHGEYVLYRIYELGKQEDEKWK